MNNTAQNWKISKQWLCLGHDSTDNMPIIHRRGYVNIFVTPTLQESVEHSELCRCCKTYGNFYYTTLALKKLWRGRKMQGSLWLLQTRARLWKNELVFPYPSPINTVERNGSRLWNGQRSSVSIPSSSFLNSRRRGENFSSDPPQMWAEPSPGTLERSALAKWKIKTPLL